MSLRSVDEITAECAAFVLEATHALALFDLLGRLLELVSLVLLLGSRVTHGEGRGADDKNSEPDDDQGERLPGEVLRLKAEEGDDQGRNGKDAAADVEESLAIHGAVVIL